MEAGIRTRISQNATVAVLAVLVAAAVGLLATRASLTIVAAAICAVLLGALIGRAPGLVFSVCLIVLCYSPEYLGASAGVFGQPSVQKGIVYYATLGMLLRRGVRARFLIAPGAYVVMALLAELDGHLASGLDLGQVLSSFVTLTVGWTALAVRWDMERDLGYLKVLSALPVLCVLLGVVLQAAGLHTLVQTSAGTSRLQGASGPAQLALTSFIACATASITYRATRWWLGPAFVVADGVILALTQSRGAAIGLGIALSWPALRFALGSSTGQRWFPARPVRIGVVVVAVAAIAALVVPSLLQRNSAGTFVQGQGVVVDKSSGRDEAWRQFYAIAKRAPIFGHGLGAGPITKIQEQGFLAQHNEYLRMFLEGGYVGGGIVALALVVVLLMCIRESPAWLRLDLVALAAGFGFLSYTDNTLTSVNLQVPFALVFGIVSTCPAVPDALRAATRRRSTLPAARPAPA